MPPVLSLENPAVLACDTHSNSVFDKASKNLLHILTDINPNSEVEKLSNWQKIQDQRDELHRLWDASQKACEDVQE